MSPRLLFAAVALSLASPAASQTSTVWPGAGTAEVTLRSFSFAPATLNLRAGVPVVLTLLNEKGGHSFSAPDFFDAAEIAPEDRARIAKGQVDLKGGEVATIRLVPSAGTYKVTCTHFMHKAFGMKGTILVR